MQVCDDRHLKDILLHNVCGNRHHGEATVEKLGLHNPELGLQRQLDVVVIGHRKYALRLPWPQTWPQPKRL